MDAAIEVLPWAGVELTEGRTGVGSANVVTDIGCGLGAFPLVLKPAYLGELTSPRGLFVYILIVALGVELLLVGCCVKGGVAL